MSKSFMMQSPENQRLSEVIRNHEKRAHGPRHIRSAARAVVDWGASSSLRHARLDDLRIAKRKIIGIDRQSLRD
jgi:hypothetical protein